MGVFATLVKSVGRRVALVAGVLLLSGCFGTFSPLVPGSYGYTNAGLLRDGASMKDKGRGFVRARPGEATRFAVPRLVGALERAAAFVEDTYPGSAPLRVGDLSYPTGGKHPRHGSHRSGRDVDLVFYVTDVTSRSVRGRGWLRYDRYGVSRETAGPEGGSNEIFFFDTARNWALVRALMLDEEAHVQWIFCSRGVKALLLEYAARHEPDPSLVMRASWVLHQPSAGLPHDDHFHVRVLCSADERAAGCSDRAPIWPWFRADAKATLPEAKGDDGDRSALTDDALIGFLMGPAEPSSE